ncbi:hypothetical protein OXYTRIMIC_737 [Oxytricha trifallax]|uniref:Uncharacterized protein n=1 Tax=Oxytricha trifallax TaxID=1172189 RepID=A0A073I098_9SPIT|nr:hypothetical protein OXYTRIMIC_737 [Oxytricha trifallax]
MYCNLYYQKDPKDPKPRFKTTNLSLFEKRTLEEVHDELSNLKARNRKIQNKQVIEQLQNEAIKHNINPDAVLNKIKKNLDNSLSGKFFTNGNAPYIKPESLYQRRNRIDFMTTIQPVNFNMDTMNQGKIQINDENLILQGVASKIGSISSNRDMNFAVKKDAIFNQDKSHYYQQYQVNEQFRNLVGIKGRCTLKYAVDAFIKYCLKMEIVDIKTHQYKIYKIPQLYELLKVEVLEPNKTIKYLVKRVLKPITIQESRQHVQDFGSQKFTINIQQSSSQKPLTIAEQLMQNQNQPSDIQTITEIDDPSNSRIPLLFDLTEDNPEVQSIEGSIVQEIPKGKIKHINHKRKRTK